MYRRFHERFGTAGVVLGVIALIVALAGSAFAASGALTAKQKKEVTKIAKKYAGKPGAPGATGPAGPAGTNGTNGKDGTNGTNGKSVAVTAIPTGEPECAGNGGAMVAQEGGSGTEVCNGQTGFTKTLPSGETETGSWSFNSPELSNVLVPLPFNIPLPAELEASKVHYVKASEVTGHTAPAACPGSSQAPTAEPGNLCAYEDFTENVATGGALFFNPATFSLTEPKLGASVAGSALDLNVGPGSSGVGLGTWAVTAP